jgi:uroporphyrinogen-III synthase
VKAFEPAIIVTRPTGQARHLIELMGVATQAVYPSVRIMSLPLLTIIPKNDLALLMQLRTALQRATLIIFVSPNAIECAMRAVDDTNSSWERLVNPRVRIGVVGQSSQEALIRHGLAKESILVPAQDKSDSEGLWKILQTNITDWSNESVLMIKGEGGREALIEQLRSVGAALEVLSIYARVPLDLASPLWQSCAELDPRHTLWTLTSSEAVRHLGERCKEVSRIPRITIESSSALCSHANLANAAQQIGFKNISVCEPRDESISQSAAIWLAEQVKRSP